MNFITRININKALKRLPQRMEKSIWSLYGVFSIHLIYTNTNKHTGCIDLHAYWKVESLHRWRQSESTSLMLVGIDRGNPKMKIHYNNKNKYAFICTCVLRSNVAHSYLRTHTNWLTHSQIHRFKFRIAEPKNIGSLLNYSRSSLSQYLCLVCKFTVHCIYILFVLWCESWYVGKAHTVIESESCKQQQQGNECYMLKLTSGTETRNPRLIHSLFGSMLCSYVLSSSCIFHEIFQTEIVRSRVKVSKCRNRKWDEKETESKV